MANWVGSFKMQVAKGKGEEVAELLAQVPALKMPGNIKYCMARDGDTIYGYEEWESKEAHAASMEIPEVRELISKAMPHLTAKPEMLFEADSIC